MMLKQFAFVLHSQPFKNTSALIELFTVNEGILTVVARGVKRPRSQQKIFLQPFIPIEVAYTGRGELKTLVNVDATSTLPLLRGSQTLLGLYLNELLIKLLQRCDAHPALFEAYHQALVKIGATEESLLQQATLREFELKLLSEIGYALDLNAEADMLYGFDPNIGLYEIEHLENEKSFWISGASVIALREGNLTSKQALQDAKKLMRLILAYHLGAKSIESRKLFGSLVT